MLEVKFIVINISIATKPYAGIFSHPPLSAEASAPKPPGPSAAKKSHGLILGKPNDLFSPTVGPGASSTLFGT